VEEAGSGGEVKEEKDVDAEESNEDDDDE